MNVNKQFSGSARASGVGERGLAIADFPLTLATQNARVPKQSSFRRDAEISTRNACAPQMP